jgi:hypothetical protein
MLLVGNVIVRTAVIAALLPPAGAAGHVGDQRGLAADRLSRRLQIAADQGRAAAEVVVRERAAARC